MGAYLFRQKTYNTISELANAMGANWDEGREFLFSGKLRNEIRNTDKKLINSILYLEKKYKADPKKGNLLFLQWLVKMPGVRNLYWMGRNFGDLEKVSASIKSGSNEDIRKIVLLMIREQIFGDFVSNSGRYEQTVINVRYLERCYNKIDTKFKRSNIFPLMNVVLSESKEFLLDGQTFSSVQELAAYLQRYADRSKEELSLKASGLFMNDANFKPAFEGWLLNIGYQKELSAWKDKYQVGNENDSFDDEVVLLENVEEKREAKEQSIEEFAKGVGSYDIEFSNMLKRYPDAIQNGAKFNGMLKDLFPDKSLQTYLIYLLYQMDIVRAINDANELNEVFTSRFIHRLSKDFGVKEDFAKWAVSIWCVSYGEEILHKKNRVMLYQVT